MLYFPRSFCMILSVKWTLPQQQFTASEEGVRFQFELLLTHCEAARGGTFFRTSYEVPTWHQPVISTSIHLLHHFWFSQACGGQPKVPHQTKTAFNLTNFRCFVTLFWMLKTVFAAQDVTSVKSFPYMWLLTLPVHLCVHPRLSFPPPLWWFVALLLPRDPACNVQETADGVSGHLKLELSRWDVGWRVPRTRTHEAMTHLMYSRQMWEMHSHWSLSVTKGILGKTL